jgi:ATP/maltotriose-dependent transcriptional regulator MalT
MTPGASDGIWSLPYSEGMILFYLVEEVFQRQPPLVQKFLLQTTLLDRLTAPL